MFTPPDWLEVEGAVIQVYQFNAQGGLRTSDHSGRYIGTYDLQFIADLELAMGWTATRCYLLAEGSWPRAEGITDESVGSYFGVNDNAGGNRSLDVTELWLEHDFWGGRATFRWGKVDFTCGFECMGRSVSFDASSYANDETSQFLHSTLVNNPTIPFPDNGLGAMLHIQPVDGWYMTLGVQDSQSDARETGFRTGLHGEDFYLMVVETGLVVGPVDVRGTGNGAYRVGIWCDCGEKPHLEIDNNKRNDTGIYLSFDQEIISGRAEGGCDVGLFGRWGYADENYNEVCRFWSVGGQVTGLIPGRDEDVLGLGFSRGIFADALHLPAESVGECYYKVQIDQNIDLSPSLQYIIDPAADAKATDAWLAALRMRLLF